MHHASGGAAGGSDDTSVPSGPPAGVAAAKAAQLTSKFTGVCWNKKNKRWQASINSGGKYLYLGSYTNELEAARVFDQAAIQLRGRDTKLNLPLEEYLDENGQASWHAVAAAAAQGDAITCQHGTAGPTNQPFRDRQMGVQAGRN